MQHRMLKGGAIMASENLVQANGSMHFDSCAAERGGPSMTNQYDEPVTIGKHPYLQQ